MSEIILKSYLVYYHVLLLLLLVVGTQLSETYMLVNVYTLACW